MGSKYSKRYFEEFKWDAIALVRSSDRTVTEIARELGVSAEGLRNWVKKADAEQAATAKEAEAAQGVLGAAEWDELKRLRKLAAEQAKTTEILKKATASFAKGSNRWPTYTGSSTWRRPATRSSWCARSCDLP